MTVPSTGVLPVSSTNTPDDRLTLPVRVSALYVSASPRIGSGGAGIRASDGSDTMDLDGVGMGAAPTIHGSPPRSPNPERCPTSRLPRRRGHATMTTITTEFDPDP